MVPKTGSRLPGALQRNSAEFARDVSTALRNELGGSHRAVKTIMAWTGVSGRTAGAWLHGRSCPNGSHLIALASHSRSVMATLLRLSGHGHVALVIDLEAIEAGLLAILEDMQRLRTCGGAS